MNPSLRELIAILTASAVSALSFAAALGLHLLLWGLLAGMGSLIPTVITVLALVASFCLALRFMRRRLMLDAWSFSSATTLTMLGLLAVTWAFGSSKVQTDLAAEEIATYKQLKEANNRVWEDHPRIEFIVSLPIAPAVLLTYHEYQLAGLYGEGRWDVHFWYGGGTIQLLALTTWVS